MGLKTEDYRPLAGMETAITQDSPYSGLDGERFGHQGTGLVRSPEQGVSVMAAIEFYTRNGAWQMGMEDRLGTLEVGKLADMVVLEKNLFNIPVNEICETEVVKTIIGGKIVYGE